MAAIEQKNKSAWSNLETVIGFDLRSLGLFRICLALVVLADLIIRFGGLTAHYSDQGLLPREALAKIGSSPFYWSILNFSGQSWVQTILFLLAIGIALLLLIGYRTRLAIIATWAMIISIHNRNPVVLFAADDVLRAILFWSMFLPLGATYSIDSALNTSPDPLPKRISSGATFAFMVQVAFIYMWSAAFKTKSDLWWPDGTAVYYSLSFDQYATLIGQWMLKLPQNLLKIMTFVALSFEWLGPILMFIPIRNSFFRCVAIVSFSLLHLGFFVFRIGIFPFLSITHWLPLIPSEVWDSLEKRLKTPERQGLVINYDADCGFCKKIVYILRTFLILPGAPLLKAQENPDPTVYQDMQKINSWVVEDWQGNRHFKWEAIIYICSLSPVFWFIAPILRWKPLISIGTKIYETIATNRRFAGNFTKPLKFRPLEIRYSPPLALNLIALLLLAYTSVWNLRSFIKQSVIRKDAEGAWVVTLNKLLSRKIFHTLDPFARITRLDQYWSIFAPNPPRDDGWYIAEATLKDGSKIDLFRNGNPVSLDKPTLSERDQLYPNMQWRSYFITLSRAEGKPLYSYLGDYFSRQWNQNHSASQQIENLNIYFMDERTVPPNVQQTVTKKMIWTQSSLSK
jgi:predicted DCC family thiol-disulfide oxidoreductase YuxK